MSLAQGVERGARTQFVPLTPSTGAMLPTKQARVCYEDENRTMMGMLFLGQDYMTVDEAGDVDNDKENDQRCCLEHTSR